MALALAGCGEVHLSYGNYRCTDDESPAIIVEFVASDGDPVAVDAIGTLRDGPWVESMVPTGSRAGSSLTYALAGGYGREGVFDVRVETRGGQVREWSRIRVSGDRCGPFTVVLQARLSREQQRPARVHGRATSGMRPGLG